MASFPSARVESLSTPYTFVPQMPTQPSRTVASRPAAHSIQAHPPATMTLEEDHRLWVLAASATEEAKLKTASVTRLWTAAKKAQAEAKGLTARATELTRQANGLARKPTAEDINKSLCKQLETVRSTRLRLRYAFENQREVEWAVDKLDLETERLKLAMDDPMVSGRLLKECLKEIEEGLAQPPGGPKQGVMQQAQTYTDSGAEELEVLEDIAEVRALFERNVEDVGSALAQAEPQEGARPGSAEHESLIEQQILAELRASAISIQTPREREQQVQPKDARIRVRRVPERVRRVGEYRPTERDMALGAKWTLLSAETVRHDLEREIQEGGIDAHIAGHVAVMRRKVHILRQFRQELDGPPGALMQELDALDDALSLAEPMVQLEQLQTAEAMLYDTDRRNSLHRTLLCAGIRLAELPNFLKRQRVDDSTNSEDPGSEEGECGRPVKRRRLEHRPSSRIKKFHAPRDHNQRHARIQRAYFSTPHDLGLLGSRYAHGSDVSEIMEDV
jgi:hypothetical protein